MATLTEMQEVVSSVPLGDLRRPPPALLREVPSFDRQVPQPYLVPHTAQLPQDFIDRFPGIVDPRSLLTWSELLRDSDSPDLFLCLRAAHPILIHTRTKILDALKDACTLLACQYAEDATQVWSPAAKTCLRECQNTILLLPVPDSLEALANLSTAHEELVLLIERFETTLTGYCEQLGRLERPHPVLLQIEDETTTLLSKLKKLELKVKSRLEAGVQTLQGKHTVLTNVGVSLILPATSVARDDTRSTTSLLGVTVEPVPGVSRVDSSASGFDPGSPNAKAARSRKQTVYGKEHRDQKASHARATAKGSQGRALRNRFLNHSLRQSLIKARKKSFNELLGDPITVWTLIILAAVAAAITTAVAIWEAGGQAQIPLLDGNFWSNLSQNLIGAAGLYCIIIPILRKAGVKNTDSLRFRVCLIISGVGALLSVGIYPLQLRTSMVLAFLSGLAQLLATLQILEDAATTVSGVNSENRELVFEGDVLRAEGMRLEEKVGDLEELVVDLEEQLAAERGDAEG